MTADDDGLANGWWAPPPAFLIEPRGFFIEHNRMIVVTDQGELEVSLHADNVLFMFRRRQDDFGDANVVMAVVAQTRCRDR